MRILILNPPADHSGLRYTDERGRGYIEREDYGQFPPLGALYVLSHLQKHSPDEELYFKDCIGEGLSQEDLEGYIKETKPHVVGVTSFTTTLFDVCLAARNIRALLPDVHLCLGGHHPIAFPHEAAKLEEFDSIVVGEGELAFTQLVSALKKGEDISLLEGVYTSSSIDNSAQPLPRDKRFLTTSMAKPAYIDNIDSLPFPDRSHIQHIPYRSTVGVTGKLATIITTRGCPFRCTFCDVPYKLYRKRAIPSIVDEIEECLRLGYEEVHFYDDLFNIDPKRVIDLCDEIEKRSLPLFPWDFRGRVNSVTYESLKRAKRAGCRLISFGVETGSDEGLKALKKETTVGEIEKAFRWCRQLGIKTVADYIIGFPFERSRQDVLKNIDFLVKLDPDYAMIGILTLFPHTELYREAVEKGIIEKGRWEAFSGRPQSDFSADYWTEHLDRRELVALRKEAYQKFYLRPSYMLRSLFSTRSFYEFLIKARSFFKLF